MAFVNLLRTQSSLYRQGNQPDELDTASLVSALEADLKGADRLKALQGLHDVLREPYDRAATAQVLDAVSWDTFSLLMECLEGSNGAVTMSHSLAGDKHRNHEAHDLCQSVLLLIADIVSPKELNLMTLEHAQVYASPRSLHTLLSMLRRSLERMPPLQRSKFLSTSIQPALDVVRRVAAVDQNPDAEDDSQGTEDNDGGGDGGDGDCPDKVKQLLDGGYERSSPAALRAAAEAVGMATDFVSPLLRQTERERGYPGSRPGGGHNGAKEKEIVQAVDRSVAWFLGYALATLSLTSTEVVCYAAAEPDENMSNATRRLLESIMMSSPASLQFILEHRCRAGYIGRQRRKLGEQSEGTLPRLSHRRSCGLGELMATAEALPDISTGVAILAHLVICDAEIRARWLPAVWSQRMQCRLFLPHAEDLMRSSVKRMHGKGLELACTVAEGLGRWPKEAGGFAFSWRAHDGDINNAWTNMSEAPLAGQNGPNGHEQRPRDRYDPYNFDLGEFIQVLLDVVVTCPLATLRGRGHATMENLLSASDEQSRFGLMRHLVRRCPWPNATGLLLDTFRKEVDRALRPSRPRNHSEHPRVGAAVTGVPYVVAPDDAEREGERGSTTTDGLTGDKDGCSPFASTYAGDFVQEQLQRACASAPASLLLMDMDCRTGALMLARFAYALDRTSGAGRLQLRDPQRLDGNKVLVEGFLDAVRRGTSGDVDRGPDYFRLYLLEDAAQQCLEELSHP